MFSECSEIRKKIYYIGFEWQLKEFGYLTYSMNENGMLFKRGSDTKLNPLQLWKLSAT